MSCQIGLAPAAARGRATSASSQVQQWAPPLKVPTTTAVSGLARPKRATQNGLPFGPPVIGVSSTTPRMVEKPQGGLTGTRRAGSPGAATVMTPWRKPLGPAAGRFAGEALKAAVTSPNLTVTSTFEAEDFV